MDTNTDTEREVVMIAATVQNRPNLSLNEAEEKLKEKREYILASGAPAELASLLCKQS